MPVFEDYYDPPPKKGPPGMKCTIRNLYQSTSKHTGDLVWTPDFPEDLDPPVENVFSAQYALIIRNKRCNDTRKNLTIDSIIVQSPLLKAVLDKVFHSYPGVCANLARLEFQPPFKPFVHRWEKFTEAKDNETDRETKRHVELLWNALDKELGDTLAEVRDLLANGVVTYGTLWAIFEPGHLVYRAVHDGVGNASRLGQGMYGDGRFVLAVTSIDFNGERFGHDETCLNIPQFFGTTKITRLPAFPLVYHPSVTDIKKKLIERGRIFEAFKGYHFRAYEGVGISQGPWGRVRHAVNSRIIIDTYAWNRFNPNKKVHLSDVIGATKKLSEEQLLICTDLLHGYSLKDKKWMMFAIPSIKEIVWNADAFASLVAPAEQKELILAFAESQAQNQDAFDDVIQGKGRGIIMLLSGPPGVGKTLTAESVAEAMKVPLYMMSSGDLGTKPAEVESALSNVLEMNTKWNAVLLLDEADVFLQERGVNDLERNKLVSIFLRLLEYFEGILFLTTNRIDNIDPAFESRIHLSLQYDELDRPSRRQVWANFVARLADAEHFSEEQLDKLAEREMNGRQIKNVLKTSGLLATSKKERLGFSHVATVLTLRQAHREKQPYSMASKP